jgi:hypothetical protein
VTAAPPRHLLRAKTPTRAGRAKATAIMIASARATSCAGAITAEALTRVGPAARRHAAPMMIVARPHHLLHVKIPARAG